MTKDELKNRISMSLKDPRLQQGFEIICKKLAELEQEKCELLGIIQGKDEAIKELSARISVLLSCKNCPENKGGYLCQKEYEGKCLAQKSQYIKELQEENAELKRDKEDLIFIRNQNAKCMCEDKETIAKAKELLNEFMRISTASDEDFEHDYTELIGETEQFLKEVEQ